MSTEARRQLELAMRYAGLPVDTMHESHRSNLESLTDAQADTVTLLVTAAADRAGA